MTASTSSITSHQTTNPNNTLRTLISCWWPLILTSLGYRTLTFLLLTPLLSLIVGWLLSTSGAAALTDLEIAEYALRPLAS